MKKSCNIGGLKYPASDTLTARTSTLCRSMACTLIKREPCTAEEEQKWLQFFPNKTCAYCGKPATHLDHLYPLIINRKPTGYGTYPGNLVPCCSQCNQSKGNLGFEEFMTSDKCEHIAIENSSLSTSIEKRIENIKKFQSVFKPRRFIVTDSLLEEWNRILNDFDTSLETAKNKLLMFQKEIYKE